MFHAIWIPSIILFYAAYSLASKQNQLSGGKWFWIVLLMGVFPGWAIVSRFSTNLLWDALLYDILMWISFMGILIYMG